MVSQLVHNDLTFAVRRSTKRRTVSIVIERDHSLTIYAPEATAIEMLHDAVKRKEDWVYGKLRNLPERPSVRNKEYKETVDGEGFWFLGRHFRLKLFDRRRQSVKSPAVYISGDRLFLASDQKGVGLKRIQEFYTREGYPYLNAITVRWASVLGVKPSKHVTVQDLGYRWGSCSADGTINYNWKVMQLPPYIVDYIAAHELCHLLVPDHSDRFWRAIEKAQPDYLERRNWLRGFSEGI